ncbi:MAG: oligosaccharyl transferase, archaeosortase A system-associated [Candidatus Methanoperedens sp.]
MAKVKPNKKYKEKQVKRNKNGEVNNSILTVKSTSIVILFVIFLFSFYIRGITPIKSVFNRGIVGFASDDAVLHMRLVENTIHFFPHRIFFDAFTLYPRGSPLHWGPLFDQINAFFSLIFGFVINGGMPAQSTIDTVGAFYPAVLGALIVFPVYFIGKELFDEKTGLIGAFLIAILPGQFLSRSLLGFTDNHVAEVFFVTLTMMFFIIAIKKAEAITFDHWLKQDWAALKTPIIYSFFAGVSFGAYLLTWTTGVFFAVVFGIFMVVQYIIDHFRGKSTEYLGVVGIIAYLVAMVMVMPYVVTGNRFAGVYYSFLHLAVMGGGALVFAILSLVSREMNKREYKGFHYLLFVVGFILIGLIGLKILSPDLYGASVGQWNSIFQGTSGGGLTVSEAYPITPQMEMGWFGYNFALSYIAILVLCYYVIKKSNAEYTLLVVWSVFVLAITLAQNRFAYYYAVNVAILSGVLVSRVLNFGDWKSFDSDDIVECLKKIRIQHILSILIIIIPTVIIPIDNDASRPLLERTFIYESVQSAQWGALSAGYYEWHDALTWMRDNTPKPDLPYYYLYEKPANGQNYSYSKNDYGVMSWWDYGNIITYWARRIPDANPFQAGIGGGSSHAPGASTYLIAPSEEEANAVLDKLGINGKPGARYVVSDAKMAYNILTIFAEWDGTNQGYFTLLRTNQGQQEVPTMKYYNTMESRLHIFDTNGLHNYRLIYESPVNPYTEGGNSEMWFKNVYNVLYKGSLQVENSGYAKIFEYVKGAKITGSAPVNATVTLTNNIRTNIERTIPYSQTTSSDGTYEFIVPYSTLGPITGETQFVTRPTGPYTVTVGNVSKQIDVSEKDVLEGGTINLNLMK